MKEHQILFSAPMVRAILDGRKCQTRRVVKLPKWAGANCIEVNERDMPLVVAEATGCLAEMPCPYGLPGDRLWVREAWNWCYAAAKDASGKGAEDRELIDYAADGHPSVLGFKWRPSIHMPRWASRIQLEVTAVRVERLQDISAADCIAEGVESVRNEGKYWRDYSNPDGRDCVSMTAVTPVESYKTLWESINGTGSWAANPWVWVVEYKRVPA
jgi:hypothetical protein